MLANAEMFAGVENMLRENGTIAQFEADNGEITGRMLIDFGEIPSTLASAVDIDENTLIYRGSFDFCNSCVGVAIDRATLKAKSQVWIEEQKLGAYQPSPEYVRYFMDVLKDGLASGIFGGPICAFLNDKASFEVYPAPAE